jgi:hypothetical protein
MKNNKDPENFKQFKIPENYFNRLFEFTGSDESSKGFILAYVSQDGCPIIYTKVASSIVEMGLRKALEKFLLEAENSEEGIDISTGD